jgi:hypothetical protein
MSWKEKMKEWAPANLLFLSSDGVVARFIVVGEPELVTTMYQRTEQERIACPVFNDDGFQLFVINKRTARKLASIEEHFGTDVITVTRHGAEGDTNTVYEVGHVGDKRQVKAWQEAWSKIDQEEAIREAHGSLTEVMK